MNKKLIEKLLLMLLWEEDKTQVENKPTEQTPYTIWDYVLVRSYYSWVIYGKYMGRSIEWGIILHESRRLYYWQAKSGISLSEVSIHGIKKDSKVTEPVDIEITDPTVCEILLCTKECIKTINAQPVYQPD